ncbi:MAG: hypothetical protein AB3X44_13200 [Leptothrix sp. (in: b-proteobacteria)]
MPILPRSSPARHALALMLLTASLLACGTASAAARLRCDVDQGGELRQFEFAPQADPYTPRPIDIGRHFRFKAVVVGSDTAVEYVKLYAYFQTSRQPVLLQQTTYLAPVPQPVAAGAHALTGTVDVFSPELGRQMRYGCALLELQP